MAGCRFRSRIFFAGLPLRGIVTRLMRSFIKAVLPHCRQT